MSAAPAGTEAFVRGTGAPAPARRRWLGPVLAGLVLLVLGVLALQPVDTETPFDPASTGPTGLRALVDTLRELGVDVQVTDDLAVAAAADNVLVPPLGWEPDVAVELAGAGPRVVAQVPPSEDSAPSPLGVAGIGLVDLVPECALLRDVGVLRTSQWDGWVPEVTDEVRERCIVRGSTAWLHVVEVGEGELVSLGTMAPLTNERFRDSDAALAGVRLLAPTGEEQVVVLSAPPGTAPPTLFDIIDRRWFDAAWLTLALLVVLALARGRRLGHPVDEGLPVRVPSGELARAHGDLRQRAGHADRSAEVLRERTLRFCRQRLGLPRSTPAQAVVDELRAHGLVGSPQVAAALTGPLPDTPDGLVATARALAEVRAAVRRGNHTSTDDH